jgi:hypothetical protein
MSDVSDHLDVEIVDAAWSNTDIGYRIHDAISDTCAGRTYRWKQSAERHLEQSRAWARARYPDRPKRAASMTRWLFGFQMLREHDEGGTG